MNPYQVTAILAGCSLVFAAVVTTLVVQGMPVVLAFLSVYVVALLSMVAMQRRARRCCDAADESDRLARAERSDRRPGSRDAEASRSDAIIGEPSLGYAAAERVVVRY